jgi:hypothetical protein
MNKPDQNIAIALTQGFVGPFALHARLFFFEEAPGFEQRKGHEQVLRDSTGRAVPEFTESETEMRKVLLTLPGGCRRRFCKELELVVCGDAAPDKEDEFYTLTASAEQQAEAYLRVLGKWSLGGPSTPLSAAELDTLHRSGVL